MAISIKDLKTERLARQMAKETGESVIQTIQRSLEERAQRLHNRRQGGATTEELLEILRRVDSLPNLDSRSEEDILGYDSQGIPRSW